MTISATTMVPKYTASTTTSGTQTEPPKGAAEPTTSVSKLKNTLLMGKDQFVKLLVAQLKNQDPLNPMDGKETASQMAQFSSVEQLMELNATMAKQSSNSADLLTAIEALKTAQTDQNDAITTMIEGQMAVSMVGKTGVTDGNALYVDRDGNGTLLVDAGSRTGLGRVTITDASGNQVGTYDIGAINGGEQAFDLAKITGLGTPLPAGKYSYKVDVVATDGGSWQAIKTYSTGRITGLKYQNGSPILTIGDSLSIPMSKLTQVRS